MEQTRDLRGIVTSSSLSSNNGIPREFYVRVWYKDGTTSQHQFASLEEATYFQSKLRQYQSSESWHDMLTLHQTRVPASESEYEISTYRMSMPNLPRRDVFIEVTFTHPEPRSFSGHRDKRTYGPYETHEHARNDVLRRFIAPEVTYTITQYRQPAPNYVVFIKFADGGMDHIGTFATESDAKIDIFGKFPRARLNGTNRKLADDPAVADLVREV